MTRSHGTLNSADKHLSLNSQTATQSQIVRSSSSMQARRKRARESNSFQVTLSWQRKWEWEWTNSIRRLRTCLESYSREDKTMSRSTCTKLIPYPCSNRCARRQETSGWWEQTRLHSSTFTAEQCGTLSSWWTKESTLTSVKNFRLDRPLQNG